MSSPRAVVWDVGHVLYDWDPRHLYAKLIPEPERLQWFLSQVVTKDWHYQHDAGRPLAEMVRELVAQHPAERQLIELYGPRWLETIPGPIPGTHAIVEELAEAGVPLFGITNFGAELWAMFRPTAPLFNLFADIIVSGEERLMKPDPAIWALAERRFGLGPEEMLLIDDNPANVAGASRAGWHVHHFVNASGVRATLAAARLLPEPTA
jgi:2-haloacid dehalogenase